MIPVNPDVAWIQGFFIGGAFFFLMGFIGCLAAQFKGWLEVTGWGRE